MVWDIRVLVVGSSVFLVLSLGMMPTRMQTFRRHVPGARNHSEKDTQLHAGTEPKNVKLAYQ